MAGTTFSDRALITMVVLEDKNNIETPIRIPDSIIQDVMLKEEVEQIWINGADRQDMFAEQFISKMDRTKDLFWRHSRQRYVQYVQKQKSLRSALISLQRLQEKFPDCQWVEM